MEQQIKYRGRIVTSQKITFINGLIAQNPHDSRRALSKKLCLAWNWVQPNGVLRDMVCRGLLLHLHRAGLIELPPVRFTPHNPLANRKKPSKIRVDQTLVTTRLSKIRPLEIRQVRRTSEEKLFDSLIEEHHYLGYSQPVGEHLKYLVYSKGRPLACLGWCSAVRHIGCRDRFIGWPADIRQKNLRLMAYNTRFLILPWVRIPYLASHLLGKMAGIISKEWENLYHHPVHFLETFVDKERFKGTCYKAANWIYLGDTTTRGENGHSFKPNRSIKAVLGYPLSHDFRLRLCGVTP
jgi:hypothetical protein